MARTSSWLLEPASHGTDQSDEVTAIQHTRVSMRNTRTHRVLMAASIILLLLVMIPVFIVSPAIGVSPVIMIPFGYIGAAIVIIILASPVPSRIGINHDGITLLDFWHLRTKHIGTRDITRIEYWIGPKDLSKPIEKRHYSVILYGNHGRKSFYCDGTIAKELMKSLPRERSKLKVYLGNNKSEERELDA